MTGDPGADAVRGFVDLRERFSPEISMCQGSCEGVAGADGIGDLDAEALMLTAFVRGHHQAAAVTAGDANQFEMV